MKRFARAWDLVANRGNFTSTTPLLWTDRDGKIGSPFAGFAAFAEWLASKTSLAAISLPRLTELVRQYLVEHRGYTADQAGIAMAPDFAHSGASVPKSLQPFVIELQRQRRDAHLNTTSAAGTVTSPAAANLAVTSPDAATNIPAEQARPARQAKHHRAE